MTQLRCFLLTIACSVLVFSAVAGEDAKEPTRAEIERLIRQLGSDDFDEREAASRALKAVGEFAREALLKATSADNDAEVKGRAEKLVEVLDANLYRELRCFKGHTDTVSPRGV